MKKNHIITILLILAVSGTASSQELLDKIVALVENEVVTERELGIGVNTMRRQLEQQNNRPVDEKVLVAQALQQIITRKLQLQEAKRSGIEIDEITLDRALNVLAQRNNMTLPQLKANVENSGGNFGLLRDQLRERLMIERLTKREVFDKIEVSDKEIRNYLMEKSDSRNNEYHIAHWRIPLKTEESELKTLKGGIAFLREILMTERISSFELLRKRTHEAWGEFWQEQDVERQLVPRYSLNDINWKISDELPTPMQDHIDSIVEKKITPSIQYDDKLHLFYLLGVRNQEHAVTKKQYHVKHILMQTNLMDGDEVVRRRLEKIKDLIEQGGDFAYFARKFSSDPGTSFKGGDLGWNHTDTWVPEFAQAVTDAAGSDEIAGPFKSSFGWHLLKVVGVKEEDVGDETARNEAIRQIRQNKVSEELRLWLLRLRENRHIEVRI